MKQADWNKLKLRGNTHYKKDTTKVEPIDLIYDGGMLKDFALANIIKYAFRNRTEAGKTISISDMEKIKHYVDMLLVAFGD